MPMSSGTRYAAHAIVKIAEPMAGPSQAPWMGLSASVCAIESAEKSLACVMIWQRRLFGAGSA